jgi:hypothetical protein
LASIHRFHPVSVVDRYAHLLDSWFEDEIAPLYEKHQQLRQESIQRKTGLLREAVEQSLRAAIQRAENHAAPANVEALREAEKELRSAAGLFTETETRCLAMSDEIRDLRPVAIDWAASRIIESWDRGENGSSEPIVRQAVSEVATEFAGRIVRALQELSGQAADALQRTSAALGGDDAASRDELAAPIRETPQIDLGDLALEVNRPFWRFLGRRITRTIVKGRLDALAGDRLDAVFCVVQPAVAGVGENRPIPDASRLRRTRGSMASSDRAADRRRFLFRRPPGTDD